MELVIDQNVKAVAEFMQEHVAASELTRVAGSLAAIAPLLWGHYNSTLNENIPALRLVCNPISPESKHAASSE